jgi:hypothetical protein
MDNQRWRVVGTLTVSEAYEHTNTFEFAAWWQRVKVEAGEYEVLECNEGARGMFYVGIPGVVVEDYFQGHFGGVPFGSYDTEQNAGKPAEAKLRVVATTAGVTMWDEPGPWMSRAEALGPRE